MYTTLIDNNARIINANNEKQSPFNQSILPYSPMSSFSSNEPSTSNSFKQELMERIRYEAKRLNKRQIKPCIITSNNNTNNVSSSSEESDQENTSCKNSPSKVKLILDEMNKKKQLTSSNNKTISTSLNENNSIQTKSCFNLNQNTY